MIKVSEQIEDIVKSLSLKRDQIKEDFTRAYLASIMPDGADINWVIQNVELVEKRDNQTVVWYFRMKT